MIVGYSYIDLKLFIKGVKYALSNKSIRRGILTLFVLEMLFIGIAHAQSPPNAPTLNSPSNGASTSTTPQLTFTDTDTDGNNIRYEVNICTNNTFPDAVVDTYSTSHKNTFESIGSAGSQVSYGQTFKANGNTLTTAQFYLSKSGTPSGTIVAEIYNVSGGTYGNGPTGSAIATSGSVNISTLSLDPTFSLITFTFTGANSIKLTKNTVYYVGIFPTGGDNSNPIEVGVDSAGSDDGDNYEQFSIGGGFLNTSGEDVIFTVNALCGLDKLSGTDATFADITTPANNDPFVSGDQVGYTVQAGDALTGGTTYFWRVRGIDPTGSNSFGSWSSTGNFIPANNSSPAAPTLRLPAANATSQSLTPALTFSDSDPDSDDLQFTINVYQSNCSTSVATYTESTGTGGTWSPSEDGTSGTHRYKSATANTYPPGVSFTPTSALSANTTYCWKVTANDPAGTNANNTVSATSLFTTNANASSPTLVSPTSTQTGLTNKPQFVLRATDPDSDYVRYQIDICSDSGCSTVLRRICNVSTSCTGAGGTQTTGQSNWTGQNQQTSSAYSSGINATYNYPFTDLAGNTTYYWRGYAIDPGGTNTWVGPTSIQSFKIENNSNSHDICVGGC